VLGAVLACSGATVLGAVLRARTALFRAVLASAGGVLLAALLGGLVLLLLLRRLLLLLLCRLVLLLLRRLVLLSRRARGTFCHADLRRASPAARGEQGASRRLLRRSPRAPRLQQTTTP
jgi:hypothetical protein